MKLLNSLTLSLIIISGLNWLLWGAFEFDLVATIFGGSTTPLAKIVYVLVGVAAVYSLTLFKPVTEASRKRLVN